MKGGVSYEEVMNMTLIEKQIMVEFIEKQLKIQAKNPLARLL